MFLVMSIKSALIYLLLLEFNFILASFMFLAILCFNNFLIRKH